MIEQLSLVDGCRYETIEVLWKYYRSVAMSYQREQLHSLLKLKSMEESLSSLSGGWSTFSAVADDLNHSVSDESDKLLARISNELSEENLDTFVSVVECAYRELFGQQYSGFIVIDEYLVNRRSLRQMY